MTGRLIACVVTILILLVTCVPIFAQVPPAAPGAPNVPGTPGGAGSNGIAPPPPPPDFMAPMPSSKGIPARKMVVALGNGGPEQISATGWPMFRHDQAHSGYTSERPQFPLKLAWKFVVDVTSDNPSSPAVVNGVVYFCAAGRLYALDAATGSLKWKYPDDQPLSATIHTSPLVGDDLVYFVAGDSRFYAIKKEDGQQAWSFAAKGPVNSSPTLVDGVVYVGSGDDHLYALDARTGQPKWPGGFHTRDDISNAPTVAGGMVYFIAKDMNLYGAVASTGQVKWVARTATTSRASTPVLSENTLIIATGSMVQGYQAQSGRLSWGVPTPDQVTTVPAVGDGGVYFACANKKLYAVTTNGKVKWKKPVDIGATPNGSPILVGDTVFVGANKGILLGVDADTGQVKWKYVAMPTALGSGKLQYVNIATSPVMESGTLYAVTDDALFAFRSDAADTTAPQVTTLVPSRDTVMSGAPPVHISAVVSDVGSGIKADSIALLLDGKPVEFKYDAEAGTVTYKTPVSQPANPLANGPHMVTLSVADQAGNKSDTSWTFTVDNRIQPKPRVPAGQQGPGGRGAGGAAAERRGLPMPQ